MEEQLEAVPHGLREPLDVHAKGRGEERGSSRSVKSIAERHVRRCRVAFTPRGSERRDPAVTTVILYLERLQVRPACPGAEMMLMLEARMGSAH